MKFGLNNDSIMAPSSTMRGILFTIFSNVDVRASFNSLIPYSIKNSTAKKNFSSHLDYLIENRELHDKIEFDIALTCYSFDIEKKINLLLDRGFSTDELQEIKESPRTLTNNLYTNPVHGIKRFKKLETISSFSFVISFDENRNPTGQLINKILEDIKHNGTLQFAGLARVGFIAIQILRSIVSSGVFTQLDYQNFLASIKTISKEMLSDLKLIDKEQFLKKYGHLRPGTYDILSARYDEEPDTYFDWEKINKLDFDKNNFMMGKKKLNQLDKMIHEHKLEIESKDLIKFLRSAIEYRELSKFLFTKKLSFALQLIETHGRNFGLSKQDLSYMDCCVYEEQVCSSEELKQIMHRSIKKGKEIHLETKTLSLPPLIGKSSDIWSFEVPNSLPNFVTSATVTGYVNREPKNMKNLSNTIVFIPNADPGFDWLFSCSIGGLVTKWGGANSHMAIRAGELELPAIVGAGEKLYSSWSKAVKLHINCSTKRVEILL